MKVLETFEGAKFIDLRHHRSEVGLEAEVDSKEEQWTWHLYRLFNRMKYLQEVRWFYNFYRKVKDSQKQVIRCHTCWRRVLKPGHSFWELAISSSGNRFRGVEDGEESPEADEEPPNVLDGFMHSPIPNSL